MPKLTQVTPYRVTKFPLKPGQWRIKITPPRHPGQPRPKDSYAPSFYGTADQADMHCLKLKITLTEQEEKLHAEGDAGLPVANASLRALAVAKAPKLSVIKAGGREYPFHTITVQQWGEVWLDAQRYRGLKTASLTAYRERLATCYRLWGSIPVVDLDQQEILAGFAQLVGEGRKGFGPHNVRRVLEMIMQAAVAKEIITKLPYNKPGEKPLWKLLPKAKRGSKARALTPHDWSEMLDVVNGHWMGWVIRAMLGTGLRSGEVAALEWRHIDWEENQLTVQQALTNRHGKRSELEMSTPKSDAGKRTISVPSKVMDELRAKYEEMLPKYRDLGVDPYKQPVFTNYWGDGFTPKGLGAAISNALGGKVDLKGISAHGLRHIHAIEMLRSGQNPRAISDRLGHEDKTLLMTTYSDALPSDDKRLALAMNGHLG